MASNDAMMTVELNREKWLEKLSGMTQQEKDDALIQHIDLLFIRHTEDLIRAGAHTTAPPQHVDVMSWAVRHTQDFAMMEKLLDLGLRCDHVAFNDFEYCFYEDPDRMAAVVRRMAGAGMPLEARAETLAYAVRRGHRIDVYDYIAPGEDPMAVVFAARRHDQTGRMINAHVVEDDMVNMWHCHFIDGVGQGKLAQAVSADGMTGWMLSVRAGQWDAVTRYFAQNPDKMPDTSQFTRTDAQGQSVISMLGLRRQLGALFTPVFFRDVATAAEMIDSLPEHFRGQVDRDSVLTAITRGGLENEIKSRPHLRLKK